MIFVSGTKRSGTSMWMQVLQAAGVPILGAAFPRGWGQTLREANPDGFYESALRQGVYYRTNPHPVSGAYFTPEDVDGYAVKVFVPGLIRSERAYITHLVANVRAWREYEASIDRLYALEDAHRLEHAPDSPTPFRFPPALEWWMENFALIRDLSLRRYPARLQTYDAVVTRPESAVPELLAWIGTGDVDAALAAVKPEHRTQFGAAPDPAQTDSVSPERARVFDALYDAVAEGEPLSGALLTTLNATNQGLLGELRALQMKVAASQMATNTKRPMAPIEGLP